MKNVFQNNRRATIILISCLIAVSVGIIGPLLGNSSSSKTSDKTAVQPEESQPVTGELKKGTPDYETILPEGKTISDYGGWTRVSPPNRNPVYAYADTIGRVPINVSQQPLPSGFTKSNTPEKIKELATGYSATKRLVVGETIVYIGTSAKGPQSVIFTKNGLLVLIKASVSVSDANWQKYIRSLKG